MGGSPIKAAGMTHRSSEGSISRSSLALNPKPSIYHPYGCYMDEKDALKGPRAKAEASRNRKNHHQSWLCRLGPRRSDGAGFYSNRTDFIRTAIRNQLERHADVVKQSTARKGLDLGLRNYTRADLEAARQAGEMLHINVLGLASIAQDVSPDLARATIASVSVLGALHATPAVKAALSDRIR